VGSHTRLLPDGVIMDAQPRIKTSAALRMTVARLRTYRATRNSVNTCTQETYICYAAGRAGVRSIVCPIILSAIHPHGSLEDWLDGQPGSAYSYMSETERFAPKVLRRVQQHRKEWLWRLIHEYEAKGD
jgi:hypothetical protein